MKRKNRTDSEISDLGNVLRTSRKLAAAKNFFAVDLYEFLVRYKSYNYEIAAPSSMTAAIFVVGIYKDFDSKVLYVCGASRFNMNRIVGSELILYLF